jgi:hypothetical protein
MCITKGICDNAQPATSKLNSKSSLTILTNYTNYTYPAQLNYDLLVSPKLASKRKRKQRKGKAVLKKMSLTAKTMHAVDVFLLLCSMIYFAAKIRF